MGSVSPYITQSVPQGQKLANPNAYPSSLPLPHTPNPP